MGSETPVEVVLPPGNAGDNALLPQSVAIIHDWLTILGGAEKVLSALLACLPQAQVHTLVYRKPVFSDHPVYTREVRTSFLDRMPGARRHYRYYLPLMPFAIEQFDLREFPLVITSSDAVGHGVLVSPDQLHINYIYTPARYAWRLYHQYLEETGRQRGLRSAFVRLVLHYLRLWDFAAAARVDHFVAISRWVARGVWRAYRREATVIYPPVDVDAFEPLHPRQDYYLIVSRLVPYKKTRLALEAFRELRLPLVVIGAGPEYERLAARAPSNVTFMGWQPQDVVREMMGRARAFIHIAEEDFGIAPVEAQAAGCPVIAFRRGGLLETVEEGRTGLFFDYQTVQDLVTAVNQFESDSNRFKVADLRRSAERFGRDRFQKEFMAFVQRKWSDYSRSHG